MHISSLFAAKNSPVIWTADFTGGQARWLVYLYDGSGAMESPEFNAWVRAVRAVK